MLVYSTIDSRRQEFTHLLTDQNDKSLRTVVVNT